MRKRLLKVLVWVGIIGVVAMASCGVALAEKQKITVFYRSVAQADNDWFNKQLEAFNKLNPAYTTEVLVVGTDYLTKLPLMVLADVPPDLVVWVGPDVAAEYVPKDQVLDLEPLMRSDPAMAGSLFYPSGLDSGKIMGKQVFLTWSADPGQIMFNTTMLDEAGLTWPDQLARNNQWTWDYFLSYAKKMTIDKNGDGTPDQWGYSSWNLNWPPNWLSWMASNGGELMDVTRRKALISQPAAYQALQFYADLKNVHNVYGGDLLTGKAAMGTGFPSAIARAAKGVNLALATNPARTAGTTPAHFLVSAGCFILKRGANTQGAWELMKFLYSDESMADFARMTKRVVLKRKIVPIWMEDFQKSAPGADMAIQALGTGRSLPYQNPPVAATPIYNIVHASLDRLMKNLGSAQSISLEMAQQIEAYMSDVLK